MINLAQIRDYVVVPALTQIGQVDPAAIRLVIGTGLIESNYEWLAQNGGPALGFWQMEPTTANDIWTNFLAYKPGMMANVYDLMTSHTDKAAQLAWNIRYAAAMCRIKYLAISAPLPHADDLEGMAFYWKRYYNSDLGSGNPNLFMVRASDAGLMSL